MKPGHVVIQGFLDLFHSVINQVDAVPRKKFLVDVPLGVSPKSAENKFPGVALNTKLAY